VILVASSQPLTIIFDEVKVYDAMIAIAERRWTKDHLADLLRDQAGGHA
jgi:hypothetical protein